MTDRQVKKYVGEKLKEQRKSANIRQEDVAKFMSLSRVSILNIESGRHAATIYTLLQFCRLFNCEPNDILPPVEAVTYTIEEKTVMVRKKKKVFKIVK